MEGIPSWAVCYIEYGERNDLSDEEVAMVDKYLEDLCKEGYQLLCPKEDAEEEFNWHPAFGLPCSTVDYDAEVVGKEEP